MAEENDRPCGSPSGSGDMIERVVVLVIVSGIVAFFGYIIVAGIIAGARGERRRLPRVPRRVDRKTTPVEEQDAAE